MGEAVRRVLVADDSITVRKLVEQMLEARGVQVLSAPSGKAAIEQIERERPDLVISDVVMPDKSGYDICTFVREHPELSSTPVLLISGVMNEAVREQAARVRSDDVIGKPFSASELGGKVDHLLGLGPAGRGATRLPPRRAPSRSMATAVPAGEMTSALKAWVAEVGAMTGVDLALVADRQGLLVEASGPDAAAPAEAVAAGLTACCAEASQGIGDAVGSGMLEGMILEFERGILLARYLGSTAILGVLLRDPAYLGKIRYLLKRAVVDLAGISTPR
jgi:CheY-like chemotaxis protein